MLRKTLTILSLLGLLLSVGLWGASYFRVSHTARHVRGLSTVDLSVYQVGISDGV